MTDEVSVEQNAISPEMLRGMAAVVGISLTAEQAVTLAPQAVQHFAQLSFLDAIANSDAEPAGELRLDRGSSTGSD
jgi:hypothetical protein